MNARICLILSIVFGLCFAASAAEPIPRNPFWDDPDDIFVSSISRYAERQAEKDKGVTFEKNDDRDEKNMTWRRSYKVTTGSTWVPKKDSCECEKPKIDCIAADGSYVVVKGQRYYRDGHFPVRWTPVYNTVVVHDGYPYYYGNPLPYGYGYRY